MQSRATTVEAYVAEADQRRQAALARLRDLCREILPGYEERMAYGMPAYARNGAIEVAFASQKQYVAFYVAKAEVMRAHPSELAGLDHGKGCIRFRNPERIDYALVRRLLEATVASRAEPC
jgi:uncharacterized protein YdhG (YjbR/CyaY superfamily)